MAGGRDYLMTSPREITGVSHLRRPLFRLLRFGLIALILSVMIVIFMWPDLSKPHLPEKTGVHQTPSNELIHPEFSSVDEGGHPYILTAARAAQRKESPDLIDLEAPSGTLTLGTDQVLRAQAMGGVLDQTEKTLTLKGGVTLSRNEDARLVTAQMDVDFRARTVRSDAPVTATFAQGTLSAAGLDATYETGVLVFRGPARVTLNNLALNRKMIP